MTEDERFDLLLALQSVSDWPQELDPTLRVLMALVSGDVFQDLTPMVAATSDKGLKADYLRAVISSDFIRQERFAESIGWVGAGGVEPILEVADVLREEVDRFRADTGTIQHDRRSILNVLAAIELLHHWKMTVSSDHEFVGSIAQLPDPVASETAKIAMRRFRQQE